MEVRLFLNQKKGDLEEYKYQSLPSKEKFLLNFNNFFFFFFWFEKISSSNSYSSLSYLSLNRLKNSCTTLH